MRTTVIWSAVALLCLTITVLEAQKYCQSGSRTVLTYYRWYGWTWARYQTKYYCKYNKNPTNRPTGTARMQNEGVQSTRVYGRPEIWYRNQWGTVCGRSGYGFDWRDATVICQMMGFGGRQSNTIAASTSLVPQGSGRVWLDYLSCSQNYEWITQCSHNGWGVTSACNNHRYDVALFCRNRLKAKLTGGPTPLEGRLWYFHGTSYRKVCDDYWDIHDATVVCRQLGFGKPFSYVTSTTVGVVYGRDYSSSFWLDNVHCTGDEMFLHHCNANDWGSEDCAYYEEIGLNCTMPVPTLTVRALSSSSISAKAEVDYYAQFGETAPIKGFRFEYQEIGDDTWHYEVPATSTNSYTYTINELDPYTTYKFKASLILTGAEQLRSFSGEMSARTWQARPGPVSGAWFQVLDSSRIRVYWTGLPEPNGVVTRYVITYWAKDPTWDHHNGRQTQENENAKQIILTGLNAYTTYAINIYPVNGAGWGENTRLVAQTREAPPNAPPQDVKLQVHDHDSVTVSWEAPQPINQRGVITNYQLTYKWVGMTGGTIWPQVAGTRYSYNVNNLPPYTLFSARVRARTSAGWGPFTPFYSVRTDEAAPGEAPQAVTILAVSSSVLEVSWQPPSDDQRNGIITTYTIQYGQDQTSLATATVSADYTSYKIRNADPHTTYYAKVSASTSVGMGPYSDFVMDKTFEAAPEGPPRDVDITVVSSTSLTVSWLIPEEEDHNGVISGYLVEIGETDTGLVIADVAVAGTELDHTFNVLTPYQEYFARVAARTSAGQGPFSDQEVARLPADIPGAAPNILGVTADQTQPSVTVTWEPLDAMFHYDSGLTAYRVHYIAADPMASKYEGTMDTTTGTATSLTLNLLDEGTAYTISVAAVNSEGLGPYSRGRPVITSGQPPDDAPMNVRVWAVSSVKLHVEWDPPPPEDHQLTITDYVVQYNEVGDNTTITRSLGAQSDTDRHEYDIVNLKPYTYYIIIVHATNDAGNSPGSIPHTVRTLSDVPDVAPRITNVMASATIARLTWSVVEDDDARGIVTGYDVSYGINVQSLRTVYVAGHVYYHDFPGLDPYTTYVWRVAARNVNGTGPFSSTRSIQTLESISTPPLLLRADAQSPTSIVLTWQPPSSPNGDITYILNYTSLHSDIVDTETFVLPKFYVTYTVYNLEEHVEYEFFMVARTTAGDSEVVIAQETTLEAPPSSPPAFLSVVATGPYSLNISWVQPPIIHHNSPLTGYKITYNMEGENEMEFDTPDADMLYYILDDLYSFMPYEVKVAALNDAGIGPFTTTEVAYTDKTLPPPVEVNMVVNSSTAITIYWDTPMYPNGVLQGYVLVFQAVYPPDIDTEIVTVNPSPQDTSITLNDLQPGANYTAKLWVTNDIGNSTMTFKWSNTMSELPTAAPSVMAMPVADSSRMVYVSWASPNTSEWKGMVKELVLMYRPSFDNATNAEEFKMVQIVMKGLVYPEDLTDSMTIDNLSPYTLYEFQMAMVNDAGMGPYSDMAYAITNEDVPEECQNFTLRVFNNNFNMTWNPPKITNGVLRGYVFYLNQKQYLRLSIENFTLYMSGLDEKTNYVVELRAFTSAGEGAPVAIAAQTGERPFVTDALEGTPSYLWYVVAACIVICLVGILLVTILGATAYKRHKKVQALKAKSGFASDDWTLYDHYEDDAFVDEKEGFQVQENPYVGHQKDMKIKNVLSGIKGLKVGKEEVTADDVANFDETMDQLGHFEFDDDDTKPLS